MIKVDTNKERKLLNLKLRFFNHENDDCFIAKGTRIGTLFEMGKGSRVNGPARFSGNGAVSLGNYCAMGHQIGFISSNHSMDQLNLQYQLQKRITGHSTPADTSGIKIGHNVWIGDGALILPNVKVGNGAVIGARAVVTKDVEDFAVVAGNPARVIKKRFDDDLCNFINELQFWNWSLAEFKRHAHVFSYSEKELKAFSLTNKKDRF